MILEKFRDTPPPLLHDNYIIKIKEILPRTVVIQAILNCQNNRYNIGITRYIGIKLFEVLDFFAMLLLLNC